MSDSQSTEILFREMERKSQDRIRVFNPLQEPFNAVWNGLVFQVPATDQNIGYGNGQSILLRYVALNWATKIIDYILTKEMDEAVIKENQRRIEKGMAKLTPWEEVETFQTPLRTDNPEKRKALMQVIWLGVEEEFGLQPTAQEQQKEDARPLDEQLVELMDKPAPQNATEPSEPKETPTEEVEAKKEALIDQVSEKGSRGKPVKIKLDD